MLDLTLRAGLLLLLAAGVSACNGQAAQVAQAGIRSMAHATEAWSDSGKVIWPCAQEAQEP